MSNYHIPSIRQQCVEQQQALLEQAKATLTAKGCTVYVAQDAAEAAAIAAQLCGVEQKALCTFSGELDEIALQNAVPQAVQTDLEAIVAQGLGRSYDNPRRAPLDGVTAAEITAILQQYLQEPVADAQLLQAVSRQIKLDANQADWGITGLDGIAADTGTIIIAEDQGNGRIVSNIPARHLAIAGLEKIYPSNDAALESIHKAWSEGGRQNTPVYYSYITGPSRTGDIEGAMVCGMHGPLAVHVILLDNGRSTLLAQGNGDVLKCIECGKCSAALRALIGDQAAPAPLTCKSLALANIKAPISIAEAQWNALDFSCPVGIHKDTLKKAMQ